MSETTATPRPARGRVLLALGVMTIACGLIAAALALVVGGAVV